MANKATNYINSTLLIIGLVLVMHAPRHFTSINNFQGKSEFITTLNNYVPLKTHKAEEYSTKFAITTHYQYEKKTPYVKKCTFLSNSTCYTSIFFSMQEKIEKKIQTSISNLFIMLHVLRI